MTRISLRIIKNLIVFSLKIVNFFALFPNREGQKNYEKKHEKNSKNHFFWYVPYMIERTIPIHTPLYGPYICGKHG